MNYLTKEEVVRINFRTIQSHGGQFIPPSNYLHEENLEYLIEAVSSQMFGVELYPSISDKAALYCHNIICNHIFSDGNKRTGLQAALLFLKLNNFRINSEIEHDQFLSFILRVAEGRVSLEECQN